MLTHLLGDCCLHCERASQRDETDHCTVAHRGLAGAEKKSLKDGSTIMLIDEAAFFSLPARAHLIRRVWLGAVRQRAEQN